MENDAVLKSLAQAAQESLRLQKRTHAQILAIEDALKMLGISQDFLTERFEEHLLNRQVRDEGLIGPEAAANEWSEHEDDQGTRRPPEPG